MTDIDLEALAGAVRRGADTSGDGCWLWVRTRNAYGYGIFLFRGKRTLAHRASYQVHYGVAPGEFKVLHSCDNPACVNPAHLRLGTQADNVRDMVERRRHHNIVRTVCRYGHPYSGDNLVIYNGKRDCAACRTARGRQRSTLIMAAAGSLGMTRREYVAVHGQSLGAAQRVLGLVAS